VPHERLVDRHPELDRSRLVTELVPPARFQGVGFDTFLPDHRYPSQGAAVAAATVFAETVGRSVRARPRWRRGPAPPERRAGIYLDGGFGVGKTHLLASMWHAAPPPKAYATFVELTNAVGALGFAEAVERLSGLRLLCVDEFELDDPGDTVLVSSLLGRLVDSGVRLAATSNTLPDRWGEGRFAADDFLREIQSLAAEFDVVRIEGEDYRHRGLPVAPEPSTEAEMLRRVHEASGATVDDFDALMEHLGQLHPSRYGQLVEGVSLLGLQGVRAIDDQAVALRVVVLADRLYDRKVPVVATGVPLDEVFAPELLRGGYRKKYFRAVSRLVALAREA
jgi:cell division protein ZapE